MKSIFKALEGGHLDRALFSSQVGEKKEGQNEAQSSGVSSWLRFGHRTARRPGRDEKRARKARSDAGL